MTPGHDKTAWQPPCLCPSDVVMDRDHDENTWDATEEKIKEKRGGAMTATTATRTTTTMTAPRGVLRITVEEQAGDKRRRKMYGSGLSMPFQRRGQARVETQQSHIQSVASVWAVTCPWLLSRLRVLSACLSLWGCQGFLGLAWPVQCRPSSLLAVTFWVRRPFSLPRSSVVSTCQKRRLSFFSIFSFFFSNQQKSKYFVHNLHDSSS